MLSDYYSGSQDSFNMWFNGGFGYIKKRFLTSSLYSYAAIFTDNCLPYRSYPLPQTKGTKNVWIWSFFTYFGDFLAHWLNIFSIEMYYLRSHKNSFGTKRLFGQNYKGMKCGKWIQERTGNWSEEEFLSVVGSFLSGFSCFVRNVREPLGNQTMPYFTSSAEQIFSAIWEQATLDMLKRSIYLCYA